ncbi:A24 family peptidase [Agromyces sp. G08B096]|uniref:A24 family peptidase n=1 Tax=Agromyces sp. G08B096 TaxID=3156399 RepID=A0AAU7W647_9MICO
MPLATSISVLIAAVLGGALGWWPLASWAARSMHGDRMPLATIRLVSAATTAVVWGVVVWRVGLEPVLPAVLAFTAASTVLAIVDLAEQRLPNRVIVPTLAVVAALLAGASAVTGAWLPLVWALLGGAAMFAAYLLLALVSPASMGMGDVKLAGVIGMLLGWFGLNAWLIGLAGAFVIGGAIAIIALALGRVTLRGSIPFGPSMLAGALVAVLLVG